ncbi:spore germination protein [Paenibacillus flagellatus]|nr:spore germination protein [Paenibacillus flagellatus]
MVFGRDEWPELLSMLKERGQLQSIELADEGRRADIHFLPGTCDEAKVRANLVVPFFQIEANGRFAAYVASITVPLDRNDEQTLFEHMIKGDALLVWNDSLYRFAAPNVLNDKSREVVSETTVQGPQFGLSEDVSTNVKHIRQRYNTEELVEERMELGTVSRTETVLLYDAGKVESGLVDELKRRLEKLSEPIVQTTGQLQNLLNGRKRTLLPFMMLTERPDRIALNLEKGKVVILMQGSPFALVLPAVFYDFMSAMDDVYAPFWISRTIVVIRYISLFLAITLPAIYISVVSFNPEFFRVQLALSVAGSRAAVPYPSFLEVLFMLFITEVLTEASIRLPKYIGATGTTVGGLILGQAAQQAGLVSSIMIIMTSAVLLCSFVIPISVMTFAIRIVKYPLALVATFFGMAGLVVGLFALIVHMADIRSFGQPYFRLFIGEPSSSYGEVRGAGKRP